MPRTTFASPPVQRLLAERTVAVLSTLNPDGAPLAAAMWFVHDLERIAMVSEARTQKVRNMRRDPRVCVVVEASGGGSRCVTVQGRAAFVGDDAQACLVDALLARYPGIVERWGGRAFPADRVLFEVAPQTVFYWGQDHSATRK